MSLHWGGSESQGTNKGHLQRATFRVAALCLVVLTSIIPFESAFAQSADSVTVNSSDSAVSGASAQSSDQTATDNSTASPASAESVLSPTDTATPEPDASVSAPADSAGSPESTSEPTTSPSPSSDNSSPIPSPTPKGHALLAGLQQDGPGPQQVISGIFNKNLLEIDKNTGALHTTYPIVVPPGRNSLQPDVSLTYNSQHNQQGSIFGEGWSTNIPYIERLNKTGVDQFYNTSTPGYFVSSFDGELATTTASSSYIARTENGAFNKYTFSNNTWLVTDKNGTQFTYGSSTDSQQSDPNNSSNVFRWMLNKVTDTNGNYITYSYFKNAGQIYPSSTVYTGNSSSTGIFEIDFQRTSSNDNATSSETGFAVRSNYRISEIDANVSSSLVRKYALAYTTGDNQSSTLLSSITESGRDTQGNVTSLPAVTFSYQSQTPGWTSSSTWNPPTPFITSAADTGLRIIDANGDGLPDLILSQISGGASSTAAFINNGHGWTSSSTWIPPTWFIANGADTGLRVT